MYQLCRCAECEKPFFFVFQRPKHDDLEGSSEIIPPNRGMFSPVTYVPSSKDLLFSYPIHVQELDDSIQIIYKNLMNKQ